MIPMNVQGSRVLPSFPEGKILVKLHYDPTAEKTQQAAW